MRFQLLRSVLSLVVAGSALGGSASAQEALTLATSGSGSVPYIISVGLSEIVRDQTKINVRVEAMSGTSASLFSVAKGQADIAMVNILGALDAYNGKKPYPNKIDLRLVAQGQMDHRQVFVRRAANIKGTADLAGKTWMSQFPTLPDIEQISNAIMKVGKVDPSTIRHVRMMGSSEAVAQLEAGTVDVATVPGTAPSPHFAKLFDSSQIDYLQLTPQEASALEPLMPRGMRVGSIPANVYPNQNKEATVFLVRMVLVADAKTPEDTVYRFVKAMYENHQDVSKIHAAARQWTPQSTADNPAMPLHPGVIKYLKEAGVWSADLEAQQAKLSN